jgi:hypothetical protein
MEKILLEELINNNMSLRQISTSTELSYSTVKYWVKKYNLKTRFSKTDAEPGKKICSRCKLPHDNDNFYKKGKDNLQPYCKSCHNQIFSQRWTDRKIWAISYKGSKCNDCNISYPETPYQVFDFHHLEPNHKDMDWSKIRLTSKDKMIVELDKCVLLCANCHRIRHSKNL